MLPIEQTYTEYSEFLKIIHKRTRKLVKLMFQINELIGINSRQYLQRIRRDFFKGTNFEIIIHSFNRIEYKLDGISVLMLYANGKHWVTHNEVNFCLRSRDNIQVLYDLLSQHYNEYNNTTMCYIDDNTHMLRSAISRPRMTHKVIKNLTEDLYFNFVLEHGSKVSLVGVDAGITSFNRSSLYVHYIIKNPGTLHDKVLQGFDELDERVFNIIKNMKENPAYADEYITTSSRGSSS